MKPLLWVVFVIPFFLSCRKENGEEDPSFKITGRVIDYASDKAIQGVVFKSYTIQCEGKFFEFTCGERIQAESISDSIGHFEISFDKAKLDNLWDPVYLGCTSLPPGYQADARVFHLNNLNGSAYRLLFDPIDQFANFLTSLQVTENESYIVYLYPEAFFQFKIPALTPALKQDTLVLHISTAQIYNPTFPLGNTGSVQVLLEKRALQASDRAQGTFQLRNGIVLKTGTFDVFCPPYQTTDVYLDL